MCTGSSKKRYSKAGSRKVYVKGRGSYAVNSLVGTVKRGGALYASSLASSGGKNGDIVFRHVEFVDNVYAPKILAGSPSRTSAFSNTSYSLNPAQDATFPILSQIARNYTLYKFEQLVFHYKPLSGELGSTVSNSLGKVMMSTNYDPDAVAFTNVRDMENYEATTSGKPSIPLLHGVECNPAMRATKELFVQTEPYTDPGPNEPSLKLKEKAFTQIGLFQVATQGIQQPANNSAVAPQVNVDIPAQPIGELWAEYKIRFSRILAAPVCGLGKVAQYQNIPTGSAAQQWIIPTETSPDTWATALQTYVVHDYANPYGEFFLDRGSGGSTDVNAQCLRFRFTQDAPSGNYLVILSQQTTGSSGDFAETDLGGGVGVPAPGGVGGHTGVAFIAWDPIYQGAQTTPYTPVNARIWGSPDYSVTIADGQIIGLSPRDDQTIAQPPLILPPVLTAQDWISPVPAGQVIQIVPVQLRNASMADPVFTIYRSLTSRTTGVVDITMMRTS